MIKYVHITFLLHVIIVKFLIVIIIMLVNQSHITAVLAHRFINSNRDTLKGHHQFLHSHPDADVPRAHIVSVLQQTRSLSLGSQEEL